MENIFEFNGKKYRLRELDLDLLNRATPLLTRYRELHYKYTSTLDTTKLDEAENEVLLLKKALDEITEQDSENSEVYSRLSGKLKSAEEKLNSTELISIRQYINDMEALALYEIITDASFMAKLLSEILVNDSSTGKVIIIESDLKDPSSLEFIKRIIADFFLLMPALSGQ